MTEQHPTTPPPEASATVTTKKAPVYRDCGVRREEWTATQASRWGWQQRDATVPHELQER